MLSFLSLLFGKIAIITLNALSFQITISVFLAWVSTEISILPVEIVFFITENMAICDLCSWRKDSHTLERTPEMQTVFNVLRSGGFQGHFVTNFGGLNRRSEGIAVSVRQSCIVWTFVMESEKTKTGVQGVNRISSQDTLGWLPLLISGPGAWF